MGGRAAEARAREPEKTSAPARDDRGRFKAGCSGNPRGALPLTPERKAVRDLAAAERVPNIATLVSIRDSSKDEWARIEACKLLLMYSDGKPVTASGPLVAMQFNQGAPAPTFGTNVDPVDATVLLATEGHLMSEEQRDQIVASVYSRANTAAQRVAERSPRPAIEAPSAAITEPEPAEKPPPAEPSPPLVDSASPGASGVGLDGESPPMPGGAPTAPADPPPDPFHDPAGCPTGAALLAGQRAREAAIARERAEGEAVADASKARTTAEAAERARQMQPALDRALQVLLQPAEELESP